MPTCRATRALAALAATLAVLAARPAAAANITIGDSSATVSDQPSVCPRPDGSAATWTAVNAFQLKADAPALLHRVLVRLPAGALPLLERVEIRSADGAAVYGSVAPRTELLWMSLATPIPVTTGDVTYLLTVTLRQHRDLPPPSSGKALAITAQVLQGLSYSAGTTVTGSDAVSATITLDNASPANVAWAGVTAASGHVLLDWAGIPDPTVLVLRRHSAPVVDVPAEGQTYAANTTYGTSEVVYSAQGGEHDDAGLTDGRPYYYRVFTRDPCDNYSTGTDVGPIFPGGSVEGDPSAWSTKPVVGLLGPVSGPATRPFKVQVRVFSPDAAAITEVRLYGNDGAGEVQLGSLADGALTRNPNYDGGTEGPASGVFEFTATTARLATGAWTLRAWASNASGGVYSGPVGVVVGDGAGDGRLLVRDNSSQLCSDCHQARTHSAEAAGNALGSWYVPCRGCHAPHGTTNAALVASRVTPPAVAGYWPPAATAFATRTGYDQAGGAASGASASRATYANGDGSGPCQVCHTRTARWRRGGEPDPSHTGRCGYCHRHGAGFAARCDDCHPPGPPTSGAHAAHLGASSPEPPFPSDPRPLGCGSCHPTDPARHGDGALGLRLNPDLVLPGGTRTAGATWVGTPSAPSCLVACHFPLGARPPPQPIGWRAPGPLPCTSCHSRVDPGGSRSLHDPIFSEARPPSGEPTTCGSCHAEGAHDSTHLTGDPGLAAAAAVSATCVACHAPPSGPAAGGPGQVLHRGADALGSRTPVPLPGWSPEPVVTTVGDFHGGRSGTGFGGTVRAPYYRGYPPVACSACHAGHASENPFLLAAEVNGTVVPAGITRSGVGGEALCRACHEGERHAGCTVSGCHAADPRPAGTGCFLCHGHEGIRRFPPPYIAYGPHDEPGGDRDCSHCHSSGWAATPETVAPVLTPYGAAPQVGAVTATSARVSWTTDEPATTWVEYGAGMPGYVAGSDAEVISHAVTLSELSPGTTYTWRIRSVDASRNVLRSELRTFTTWSATAVPAPDVAPVYAGAPVGTSTTTARLLWYPVAAPSGTSVAYEVQLASDPAFTRLDHAALAIADPSLATGNSGWIPGIPDAGRLGFDVTLTDLPQDDCSPVQPVNVYFFRVRARDALGTVSEWSATGSFGAGAGDPLCG